jgi:hypothetical protein
VDRWINCLETAPTAESEAASAFDETER